MGKRKGVDGSPGQPSSRKEKRQKKGKKSSNVQPPKEAIPESVPLPPVRKSGEDVVQRGKWANKNRVLVFSSRGINYRARHLMNDFKSIMPHSKGESKMNKKEKIFQINEACEMKNCNLTMFFEARKGKDLYVWFAKTPDGPSARFLVENVHTMDELKMTGNCLKGSRPILSFDKSFEKEPQWELLRELFAQVFNTPNNHPKSQPFIDRVMTFSVVDNRIWIRNFQIVEESGALAEIGPRVTLNPIKIFDGSFRGECIYENPHYISPNLHRRNARLAASGKYVQRVQEKIAREDRIPETAYPVQDETEELFRQEDKNTAQQQDPQSSKKKLKTK